MTISTTKSTYTLGEKVEVSCVSTDCDNAKYAILYMDGENTGDQTTFEDSITPASFTIEHDTTFDTEGSHTIKAKIFYNTNMRGQILLAESNEITITVEAAPEAGTPVPDVPLEQLVISLLTDDDHDELEFIGGFHDSETSANITDTDISDAMFVIGGNTYNATVTYDSVSNHLIFRHVFEGAYTGTIPETGILAFTYNDEGTLLTVAFEDARE